MKRTLFAAFLGLILASFVPFWGFHAHRKINRLAVFTLPPGMIEFYKANIDFLSNAAVNADKRRYTVEDEAARHYLDVDHYGDSAFQTLPHDWSSAVSLMGADTLRAHGILPWHLHSVYFRLRQAFLARDAGAILRISADIGHYIADAHVPLHTTKNYNGQLTGQEGIHAFWESRLPEIFSEDYDFFVGPAEYIPDTQSASWQIVSDSHALVETVLGQERELDRRYGERKYSHESRGNATVRVYAVEYARHYHRELDGMVEERMRASVKRIGDFWFTAWVDAGQPDLGNLSPNKLSRSEIEVAPNVTDTLQTRRRKARDHE